MLRLHNFLQNVGLIEQKCVAVVSVGDLFYSLVLLLNYERGSLLCSGGKFV